MEETIENIEEKSVEETVKSIETALQEKTEEVIKIPSTA